MRLNVARSLLFAESRRCPKSSFSHVASNQNIITRQTQYSSTFLHRIINYSCTAHENSLTTGAQFNSVPGYEAITFNWLFLHRCRLSLELDLTSKLWNCCLRTCMCTNTPNCGVVCVTSAGAATPCCRSIYSSASGDFMQISDSRRRRPLSVQS
jgi:hypothetical protein